MWALGGSGQACEARATASALACASSAVQAPISTSRKPAPGGQLVEILEGQALAAHEIDQQVVEAFEADGTVFERARDGVGGEECVVESQHREHAEGRAGGEVERGGDDVAQVPSEPTSARATWKPFSSSSSSRL